MSKDPWRDIKLTETQKKIFAILNFEGYVPRGSMLISEEVFDSFVWQLAEIEKLVYEEADKTIDEYKAKNFEESNLKR